MLNECPTGSDKNNSYKQHSALEQMCNIVKDGPGFDMLASLLNEMVINRMEH